MKRSAKVCWVGFVFSTIIIAAVAGLVVYFTSFKRASETTADLPVGGTTSSGETPAPNAPTTTASVTTRTVAGSGDSTATTVSAPTTTGPPTTSSSAVISLDDHLSHSVPGFAYEEVDYDGDGFAEVQLDGSRSHTHYFDEGPPIVIGKLIEMIWFNRETREEIGNISKPLIKFPVGVTVVGLTVTDNYRDSHTDYATITVKKPVVDGAYCYYYEAATAESAFTISDDLSTDPKPIYADPTASISFEDDSSFPTTQRGISFQMRCVFLLSTSAGTTTFTLEHFGPVRMLIDDNVVLESSSEDLETTSADVDVTEGEHKVQILYSRKSSASAKLELTAGGSDLQYDISKVLPVLTKIDPLTSTLEGGGTAKIDGIALLNDITIKFGDETLAVNAETSSDSQVFVSVPEVATPQVVSVVAVNKAGTSNPLSFQYSSSGKPPIKFKEQKVTKEGGAEFELNMLTGLKYGPDHRYYASAINNIVYSFAANSLMETYDFCRSPSLGQYKSILGLAFNPADTEVKLYVSASVLDWKKQERLTGPFAWANGEILLIMKNINGNCLDRLSDPVITGLPVSNHDHGVNGLIFDNEGKLHIQVGGSTNAGHNDKVNSRLGGIDESPLSGASLIADVGKSGFNGKITYGNSDPGTATQTGGDVEVYSPGWRNSFGITIHSNGFLYATDNGASVGFGDKSINCTTHEGLGVSNLGDKLGKVLDGKYAGHPNRNRGRSDPQQCVFRDPAEPSSGSYQAPIARFESSTDGVIEYTADVFGGQLKGDLILSKYSTQDSNGKLFRVQLDDEGNLKDGPDEIWAGSGLSIQMSPYGHILMPRVYKYEIMMLTPQYQIGLTPMLIAVMPFRGPSQGGNVVLVTGEKFGESPIALFDGVSCTEVTEVAADGRSFKCKVPPGPKNKGVKVSLQFADSSLNVGESDGVDYRYMNV